jgi:hypothetical protein
VYDENGLRKRVRRRPEELLGEKNHMCPYYGCEKTYTSKCSLYLHIKRNHGEEEEVKEGEVAPVRTNSKVKKGVNIYKVFKKSQAEKYECRINFETANTTDFSERETHSFNDCASKKKCKISPTGSNKTSIAIDSTQIDGLTKYFEKFAEKKVEEEKETYAKEEIFSCEDKLSRKTSFSVSLNESNQKFEDMSDDVVSVLCLDYEDDRIYDVSTHDHIYESVLDVQGEVEANDELSGLLFNAGSDHLVKREFEFLDFEDQDENEFNYGVALNNTTPFELFI